MRVDVEEVRRRHPIADVVAAAGVQLRPAGHGFIGCCPFHDDTTPSLSVGGVPDRFTCFGCGAHGDVIDFTARLHGLTFLDAVHHLDGLASTSPSPTSPTSRDASARTTPTPVSADRPESLRPVPPSVVTVLAERGFEINALAWQHLASPVRANFAIQYLLHHRGLDLRPLTDPHAQRMGSRTTSIDKGSRTGEPVVGYAGHGWTTLGDALRRDGVTDDELLVMDLAYRTRRGTLIDTLRDRIVVPVTDHDPSPDRTNGTARGAAGGWRIRGFIGRDISGDPRAPKYRNPTHTPTFDKAEVIYRPTQHLLDPGGTVVVVEGVLDALAIAAQAAAEGRTHQFAPCAPNGVTVSPAQAAQVLGLARKAAIVIALDADPAGREGTRRWLHQFTLTHGKVAYVTHLPHGTDPADWVREHPADGLTAFDPRHHTPARRSAASRLEVVSPTLPARELTRLAADGLTTPDTPVPDRGPGDPIRRTARHLLPLIHQLSADQAQELLETSESEMTRLGWNPDGAYSTLIRRDPHARRLLIHPPGPSLSAQAAALAPTATASTAIARGPEL